MTNSVIDKPAVQERSKKSADNARGPAVFPLIALAYFCVSLLILAGIVFLLDRVILPSMEDSGKLESPLWSAENKLIDHYIYMRNKADKQNPVWRSAQWPVDTAKKKEKRILVMGDSFVWGDGYANMNTIWWRQLEKELVRRGYNNVEVIGAGLCGASTRDELEWCKKLAPTYKPDLVIFGYVTNDPSEKDAAGQSIIKPIPLEEANHTPLRKTAMNALPSLAGHLFQLRDTNKQKSASGKASKYEYNDWELKILQGENFERYKQTVLDLAAFRSTSGIPIFVLSLPNGFTSRAATSKTNADFYELLHDYYSTRYEPVKKLFAEKGIPFIDTIDEFTSQAKHDSALSALQFPLRLGINPGNGHPGPFATHFYAVKAADLLERDYSACLGARQNVPVNPGVAKLKVNDFVPPNVQLKEVGANKFSFLYLYDKNQLLYMPMRKPFVQLNLEEPTAINTLRLSGADLKTADIYLSYEDGSKKYDEGRLQELGTKNGSTIEWNLPNSTWSRTVDVIRISAKFKGKDHNLVLEAR